MVSGMGVCLKRGGDSGEVNLSSDPCSLFCLFNSVGALPPAGPRNSSSAPPANPPSSLMNPSLPFTSSPDPTPSQNPLSLMMSQMSKYAMPSSTPLYHNAIKTIATSDDELLPDRPLLPPPPPPQGSGPGARRQSSLEQWVCLGHAGFCMLPQSLVVGVV